MMMMMFVLMRTFTFSWWLLLLSVVVVVVDADIFIKIPGVDGEARNPSRGEDGWIVLDSMQFGVDRKVVTVSECPTECPSCKAAIYHPIFRNGGERGKTRRSGDPVVVGNENGGGTTPTKESGEKGGTADINIGVGELQECTITKSMDMASATLAQHAINGLSLGDIEIDFIEGGGGSKHSTTSSPRCYLRYKLDRCFVKSWSTSGDADDRPTEEVAFYYNKIAFAYSSTKRDGSESRHHMGWDNTCHKPWSSTDSSIPTTNLVPIHAESSCPMQTPPS